MNWTDGYIDDVSYPAFFYKEMQPLWLATVAAFQGFAAPDVAGPFALCELGCGVGVNLLVAAACHPQARFVGVDFNGEHVDAARAAASASGIDNVEFIHADFATFTRTNRDKFDFVTCHGVWSWIAPPLRADLVEYASRSLTSRGLLYLHYMCHPGSTELLPLQHLLDVCAHHMPGSSERKVQVGMKLLHEIAGTGLFAEHPAMSKHLANMARRDPADLAHEFLTRHWQPSHSADVHQQVGSSGLAYIGSADVFNNLDVSLSIPGRMQGLIRRTGAPALAETLKDLARHAHQRMDLFQKEPAPPDRAAFATRSAEMRFAALPSSPSHGPTTFTTPIGPVTGPEAIFTPLLRRLNTGAASVGDLARIAPFTDDPGALSQALQLLMMQQFAHPVQRALPTARQRARALSGWLQRNGVALTIVEECATAVAGGPAG